MSQNPNQQGKKSKKALQQEALISPSWFPDARWHARTLGIIYALLTVAYFGVSHALSMLPKPYNLRRIPVEMTPWLNPGGKVHLPEDQLHAPEPDLPPAPTKK
ncbi:MAG: hypothetical protein M0D55_10015 [Elusimicrobiota bacterium]|nr:MAG: hypothetical protein M0D55_10015 [Elusimicrobiota bacterium]